MLQCNISNSYKSVEIIAFFQFYIHILYILVIHLCLILLFSDSELEELETTPRYRPDSLSALCRTTRFTEAEIKRIYRGFKAECPTGVVKEDTFKVIYSQFFPQGGLYPVGKYYILHSLTPYSQLYANKKGCQ